MFSINWIYLIFCWVIPLTLFFQIATLVYTITEHRWFLYGNEKVETREQIDNLSYLRVCCSVPPKNGNFFTWINWWIKLLLFHLPYRIFIVVGDTVQHDLHHTSPNCDWPNSLSERQEALMKRPYRYNEVWGGCSAHLLEATKRI